MGLAVSHRATRSTVVAWVHLVAPNGQHVHGARVTFWVTRAGHPGVHIPARHATTNVNGNAAVLLRLQVTERISATATYGAELVAPNVLLRGGRVAAAQSLVVRFVRPGVALSTLVVREAAALRGRPYAYGAAGPSSFDCSGYTEYVMAHAAHRYLPHNAAAQYADSRHEPRSAVRPGDLVFFTSGGHVYHVGIYAGGGRIWHAPHPGSSVRLEPIFSSSWVAGRVI
jgi:cell wall-associated NlpC family hydrolase